MLKDGSGALHQAVLGFHYLQVFPCRQKFEVNKHGGDQISKKSKPTSM